MHRGPTTERDPTTAASEARRYFRLTFLWTWAFWIGAAVSGVEWPSPAASLLFALGGIGPALAASVLVYRGAADEGLGAFWKRVIDPRRIPGAWYLIIPAVAIAPPLLAHLFSGGSEDIGLESGSAAVATLIVGVLAGLTEEPGWRGYALDRLQAGSWALGASLVLGVYWSLWHLPLFFINGTYQNQLGFGTWESGLFLLALLPASVLYTWIYNNTNRSILSVVLFHAIGNAAGELIGLDGAERIVAFTVALGLAAFVTALSGARTLTRRPSRTLQHG